MTFNNKGDCVYSKILKRYISDIDFRIRPTIVFEIAEPHKKQRCTSKNSCFLHEI